MVVGVTAAIRPVEGDLRHMVVDLVALIAMTVFAAIAVRTARRVTRWEGAVLLVGYVTFLVVLVVRA